MTEALLKGNGAELGKDAGPAVPEEEEEDNGDPVGKAVTEALLNESEVELDNESAPALLKEEDTMDPVGNAVAEELLNGNGAELDNESAPAEAEEEEMRDPVGNAVTDALLKGNGGAVEATYFVDVFVKERGPADAPVLVGDVPVPVGLLMVSGPAETVL